MNEGRRSLGQVEVARALPSRKMKLALASTGRGKIARVCAQLVEGDFCIWGREDEAD